MANTEAEAVDFEPEDDDLMDEDGAVDVDASSSPRAPLPKIKSAITGGSASPSLSAPKKTKGRGFREEVDTERQSRFSGRGFDSLGSDGGPGPQRSVEGWIILVSGVHEEAQDDHLQEAFGEFGEIKNLHLNLDRRTGFVKGYALIEYENFEQAENAIASMNGGTLLEQVINVDWAFSNGPSNWALKRKNMRFVSMHYFHKLVYLALESKDLSSATWPNLVTDLGSRASGVYLARNAKYAQTLAFRNSVHSETRKLSCRYSPTKVW
ncbi:hypothetical protein D5086_017886 [Populus alba]|uniref:Uncharacterized protein n=1 Tax=Populus alba TaxID=43335 RepID=A0ACC4BPE2_POPAL